MGRSIISVKLEKDSNSRNISFIIISVSLSGIWFVNNAKVKKRLQL